MLNNIWKPVTALIFSTLPSALADGGQHLARLITQACYNDANQQNCNTAQAQAVALGIVTAATMLTGFVMYCSRRAPKPTEVNDQLAQPDKTDKKEKLKAS